MTILLLLQCSNKETSEKHTIITTKKAKKDYVKVISPAPNQSVVMNDFLDIKLTSEASILFDSAFCIVNNQKLSLQTNHTNSVSDQVKIPFKTTGKNTIKFISYIGDSIIETDYTEVMILSDIVPKPMTYKILNIYKHKTDAYTQGLAIENGLIYEGTGSWGMSRLMKYKPENSDQILNEVYISSNIFGEGIEIFDDKIVQITYHAQKGFIYKKSDLKKIKEFDYPYIEGWGITYDGTYLIMSDGSHHIYFLDKNTLREIKQIEVCDNIGIIDSINEMEYVNGIIYANVYRQNFIITIDPLSGKVLHKIDMSDMLEPDDFHSKIDVLNGIAYNEDSKTFFVTGKNWPKLFEVDFIESR